MDQVKERIIQMMPATGWNIVWKLDDKNDPFLVEPVLMWILRRSNNSGMRRKDGTRIADDHFTDEIYGIAGPTPHDYFDIDSPENDGNFLGYIKDSQNPADIWPEHAAKGEA